MAKEKVPNFRSVENCYKCKHCKLKREDEEFWCHKYNILLVFDPETTVCDTFTKEDKNE